MLSQIGAFPIPRRDRVVQYIKARAEPSRIPAATVHTVLDRYGLRPTHPPRNMPFGRRNRLVTVETNGGKKVLKRYRAGWQTDTILHEHSILQRLAAIDFPAPRLATTNQAASLVSLGDQHYALFDFAAGINFASSYLSRAHRQKLVHRAGITLAHLHHHLDGFVPAGTHHLGYDMDTAERRHDLDWYLRQLDCLPEKSMSIIDAGARHHADELTRHCAALREALLQTHANLDRVSLPRCIIHGDYGIHNLLFQRDGTVIVHDFELARPEWRLSDLVITLSRMKLECRSTFATAYRATTTVAADEWQLLPQVWQMFMLQGAIRAWHNYFELGDGRRLASARNRIAQADWALAHCDLLGVRS